MSLTDFAIRSAKPADKDRKLTDRAGLYLLVRANGSKLWRMDYAFGGKRKTLALGAYPEISLATARGLRDRAKMELADGRDPHPKARAQAAAIPSGESFEGVAREWWTAQAASWVPAHASRVLGRFERDVFPILGPKPVARITSPEVLEVIRTKRLRQWSRAHSCVFRLGLT